MFTKIFFNRNFPVFWHSSEPLTNRTLISSLPSLLSCVAAIFSAPGSGPMFRSTTVAVDPTDQSRPDFQQNWANSSPSSASLGTKPQSPFLTLDLALETRLLHPGWTYQQTKADNKNGDSGIVYCGQHPADRDMGSGHTGTSPCASTATASHSLFNQTVMTSNCRKPPDTSSVDTTISSRMLLPGASRLRPVSFSLPKRSTVLLHQAAAIFMQPGLVSNLSGKPGPATTAKGPSSLGGGGTDVGLKCLVATKTAGVNHFNAEYCQSEDSKAQSGPARASIAVGQSHVTCLEDTLHGTGAHLSLFEGGGTDADGSPLKRGTQVSDGGRSHSALGVSLDCQIGAKPKPLRSDVNPQTSHSGVLPHPADAQRTCYSASAPPTRSKEPFCPVLSRDCSRVFLWPTEMINYTKNSPPISYSVNPLLYDFRAHSKAKYDRAGKGAGAQGGGQRMKPSDCQRRRGDEDGGGEGKMDEGEEEGRESGSPEDRCGATTSTLEGSGCPHQCPMKCVPIAPECLTVTTSGHQKSQWRRRGKKKRDGGKRGMRRRGRRKSRRTGSRTGSERGRRSVGADEMFEVKRDEGVRRKSPPTEERREKEHSNLSENLLVGRKEKNMRGVEERIKGDQTDREGPGWNDKKKGELLSNLAVSGCNRWNQLCLQVEMDQAQQSASGWGQGLRKLLCGGTECSSVISPVHKPVVQMPCCPAITSGPSEKAAENGERNAKADKEDEEQRNLRKTQIRAVRDTQEQVCKPLISCVTFTRQDSAHRREMNFLPERYRAAECDPAITPVPSSLTETDCNQRQTITAGHGAPSCRFAQQKETEPRIRAADIILPSEEASETCHRVAATKRVGAQQESATPRKKRRRGRRQTRRAAVPEQAAGFISDLSEPESSPDHVQTPGLNIFYTNDSASAGLEGGNCSCNSLIEQSQGGGTTEPNDGCHKLLTPVSNAVHWSTAAASNRGKDFTDSTDGQPVNLTNTLSDFTSGGVSQDARYVWSNDHGTKAEPVEKSVERWGDKEEDRRRVKGRQEERFRETKKEKIERERKKEVEFEHLFTEKTSSFPHHLPQQCIPLNAPLLFQTPFSSPSSFSFHHTIIQHNFSLLPPPSPLPALSYPHILPSFSPLTLDPPPAAPPPPSSVFTSLPFPLLDHPAPYPFMQAFHPVSGHPPSPYPPLLPLRVLF
ncbi:uncharacterized protein LOC112138743 isoform X2 [Oryzias melastigma]|uniref:uncharacterized protein LOC112138743 isoform X2 n=1 Tax=Oryzias melastigma TaxID=30732 RepID=UPI00168D4894|nr:uncharacterized protein LOC112138743 isoform X2 [Oryzias melastigma]